MPKLLTVLFLIFTLNGFAQVTIPTIGEGKLAPDFPAGNTILVVFKDPRKSVNKQLEKQLENYKGEFRLLEMTESLSPKDTSKTRFFVMVVSRFEGGHFVAGGREGPSTEYQMTMTDRKTNLTYYSKDATSCFRCLFEEYFKKLEKLRSGSN